MKALAQAKNRAKKTLTKRPVLPASTVADELMLRLHQTVIMQNGTQFQETLRRIREYVANAKTVTVAEIVSKVPGSDERGMSVLLRALEDGFYDRAKVLIEAGASCNTISTDTRGCALHYLITSMPARLRECPPEERQELEELILFLFNACVKQENNGARSTPTQARKVAVGVDWQDLYRRTPLHLAVESNLLLAVKWLINNHADPSPVGPKQKTPLYIAADKGHTEAAKLLLLAGAGGVLAGPLGSPKEVAQKRGHSEILKLIESHAMRQARVAKKREKLVSDSRKALDKMSLTSYSSSEQISRSLANSAQQNSMGEAVKELLMKAMRTDNAVERKNIADAALAGNQRPLHIAAAEGNLEVVDLLLLVGAEPDVRDKNDWSPLHYAAEGQHYEIMKLLLERGNSVLATTRDNATCLHIMTTSAVDFANAAAAVAVMDEMARLGLDVNAQNAFGETALHLASHCGCITTVKWLLTHGALPNLENDRKETPLHYAARTGNLAIVILLERSKAKAWHKGQYGTPRDVAFLEDRFHVVAHFDVPDKKRRSEDFHSYLALGKALGIFMLFEAIGDAAEIKELVRSPISKDSNVVDREGNLLIGYPLSIAAAAGNEEVAKLLIDHGADVNVADEQGWTPLLRSAQAAMWHVCELLLENGVDVSQSSYRNATALHYLAATMVSSGAGSVPEETDLKPGVHSSNVISEELLYKVLNGLEQGGIDINQRSRGGETALHRACLSSNIRVIKYLLEQPGVDVDAPSKHNESALHYACRKGNVAVVQALLRGGATRDFQVGNGGTPSDVAWAEGHKDVCEVLEEEDEVYLRRKLKKVLKEFTFKDIERLLETAGQKGIDVKLLVNTPIQGNQTPLHCAVCAGHVEASVLLLQQGANPNALDDNGYAPLHLAAMAALVPLCIVLIDHGALFSVPGEKAPVIHCLAGLSYSLWSESKKQQFRAILALLDSLGLADKLINERHRTRGETALHEACHTGQLYIAKWLILHGAQLQAESKTGMTPLMVAVRAANIPLMEMLLEYGAMATYVTSKDECATSVAMQANKKEVLECLREEEPGVVEDKLAAVLAEGKDEYEAVRLLRKANRLQLCILTLVNKPSPEYLQTPLHHAVIAGNYRMVDLLLKQGAEINSIDKPGNSPLHYAFQHGQLAIGELLLERNADITSLNSHGTSAFHYLVGVVATEEEASTALVASGYLAKTSTELTAKEEKELALLKQAHSNISAPLFRYLLELMLNKGQDINVANKSFETPLHRAVLAENVPAVRYLLKHGADPNRSTTRGETPLHFAARKNSLEMVRVLIAFRADTKASGNNGLPKNVTTSQEVIDMLACNGRMQQQSSEKSPFGKGIQHHQTVEEAEVPTMRDVHYDAKYTSKFGAVYRWEARMSPSGTPYYCDLRNRAILWELPEETDLQEILHGDETADLPQWERRIHFSGEFYYVNNCTKDVMWELPEGVLEQDIVCFDVDVVEEDVFKFKMDVEDENDPAYHYSIIENDPRFKRLLVKHCPSWFTAQGAKQNLQNMVDLTNVPGLSLAVKAYRTADQYTDVRRFHKVVDTVDDAATKDLVKTMGAGMHMEATKRTANLAIAVAFKALLFAIPIQSLIPGYVMATNAAAFVGGKFVEKVFSPVASNLVTLGLDEALLAAIEAEAATFVTNAATKAVQGAMKTTFTTSTKEGARFVSLFAAEQGLTHGINQGSSLVNKTLLKYGASRAFLKYLGYPEDRSDVYTAWEDSRLFLKGVYGAAPDDNLYLMEPSAAMQAKLHLQEVQRGGYDVDELPDCSTLQLLWRAYDCWDALNYYDKALRVGSKVVSMATDTHRINRHIDRLRDDHARKVFYDPSNPALVCLSSKHEDELAGMLLKQWTTSGSLHVRKIMGLDAPTAKQFEWLAHFYVQQFIQHHRIWGYIDPDSKRLLAAVFWEPASSPPALLSKELPLIGSPEVLLTLGFSALRSLNEAFSKMEKLRRDRTATATGVERKRQPKLLSAATRLDSKGVNTLKRSIKRKLVKPADETAWKAESGCIHMFTFATTEDGLPLTPKKKEHVQDALLTIMTKLLQETPGGIFSYCWLFEKTVNSDFYQDTFNFRVLGSDPVLNGHVVSLWRPAGLEVGSAPAMGQEEIAKDEQETLAVVMATARLEKAGSRLLLGYHAEEEGPDDERRRLIALPSSTDLLGPSP